MDKLRLLDLFSGIGGFSLGLERTGGFRTVAFCERDPFCQKVLAKHWSEVPIYDDVCSLTGARLAADGIAVDAIAGGFPCQDISAAGKGAGIEGSRSGLWKEYARLIGELRPRIVFVENVRRLLGRGMSTVCGDLASIGYDAEWHVIPAAAVGAPHRRERVWIVAYPRVARRPEPANGGGDVADANGNAGNEWRAGHASESEVGRDAGGGCFTSHVPHARCQRPQVSAEWGQSAIKMLGSESASGRTLREQWAVEPDMGRVANGVPKRVDRLKSLGNAVMPQVVEMIGRAALETSRG